MHPETIRKFSRFSFSTGHDENFVLVKRIFYTSPDPLGPNVITCGGINDLVILKRKIEKTKQNVEGPLVYITRYPCVRIIVIRSLSSLRIGIDVHALYIIAEETGIYIVETLRRSEIVV